MSIAMCTYNGADYLRPQLESFLAQSRRPDELVVCDDGSSDQTVEILREFARAAPFPVRIFENRTNIGLHANFAQAFARASGEIVLFSDQDDLWQPQKLARFEQEFAASPTVGLVFCDARVVDRQLQPLGHTHWDTVHFCERCRAIVRQGRAFELLLRHSFVAGATMGVASRLRPALLPVPAPWPFDGWVAVAASALAETRIIEQTLNEYRQHPTQAIGGRRKGLWRRYVEARRAVDERYHLRVAEMADSLKRRLLEQGVPASDQRILLVEAKATFARQRAAMRRSILKRYPLLIGQLLRGRYHQFGQGWRSAAMDALV
ncbi:MAG: glycosyltransferase family 2 protein [Phycisphaerales bacterium]|nr:glycosyltransferase family 2 protein [Phycisphaerales bacterium]